jgi:hypothetical protein
LTEILCFKAMMALITLKFGDLITVLMKDGMFRITQMVANLLFQLIDGVQCKEDVDLER